MNINNSNNSNIPTDTISEINIFELLLILFKNKYTIILCTFIFAISSVFYSLSIPNQYISKSVVSINGDTEVTGGALGGNLGGIASLAGISLSSDGDVSKSSIVEATFKSRVFISHLLNQEKFLFNLMAVKGYDVNNNKDIIDTNLYDIDKASWKTNKKPRNIDSYYAFLNNFSYSKDDETGLVQYLLKIFRHIFLKIF